MIHCSSVIVSAVAVFGFAIASAQPPAADVSPPLSRFHIEFVRNFRNLLRADNIEPLLWGGMASLAAVPPEERVAKYFKPTRRLHEFGDTGQVLGGPGVSAGVMSALFAAGRMSHNEPFREITYSLAQASAMNLALSAGIKACVKRERPNHEDQRSFYSGHTANAFAWATILSRHHGVRAAIPAYAVAALIGASRLEKNKHYLSDVAAGAMIGHLIGRSVTRSKDTGRRHAVIWGVSPVPGGLAIHIQYVPDGGHRGGGRALFRR